MLTTAAANGGPARQHQRQHQRQHDGQQVLVQVNEAGNGTWVENGYVWV